MTKAIDHLTIDFIGSLLLTRFPILTVCKADNLRFTLSVFNSATTIYGVRLSRLKKINRNLPMLKAPARLLAKGNALGSGINRSFRALKGPRIPPPFQGGQYCMGRYTRGVAPG